MSTDITQEKIDTKANEHSSLNSAFQLYFPSISLELHMSPASIKAPHTLPLCLEAIHIGSSNDETITPQHHLTMDREYSFALRGNENDPETLRKETLHKFQIDIDEDLSKRNTQSLVQSLKAEGFILPSLEEASLSSELSLSPFTTNLDPKSPASTFFKPEPPPCTTDSQESRKPLFPQSTRIEKTQGTQNHDPSEKVRRRALRKIRNRASAERSRIRKQQGIEKLKETVVRLHSYNQFLRMSLIQVHTSLLEIVTQKSSTGDPSNAGSTPTFATASEILGQALQTTRYAYQLASDHLMCDPCSPRSTSTNLVQGSASGLKPTEDGSKNISSY